MPTPTRLGNLAESDMLTPGLARAAPEGCGSEPEQPLIDWSVQARCLLRCGRRRLPRSRRNPRSRRHAERTVRICARLYFERPPRKR